MPTWGQSQGGTLNDEQIRQLATLITEGASFVEDPDRTGWDLADEFAIHGDHEYHYTGYASAGITLTQADRRVVHHGLPEQHRPDRQGLAPRDRRAS